VKNGEITVSSYIWDTGVLTRRGRHDDCANVTHPSRHILLLLQLLLNLLEHSAAQGIWLQMRSYQRFIICVVSLNVRPTAVIVTVARCCSVIHGYMLTLPKCVDPDQSTLTSRKFRLNKSRLSTASTVISSWFTSLKQGSVIFLKKLRVCLSIESSDGLHTGLR